MSTLGLDTPSAALLHPTHSVAIWIVPLLMGIMQFLHTVKVGGKHRTPRWIAATENSAKPGSRYVFNGVNLK